jgi:hypothetical protein
VFLGKPKALWTAVLVRQLFFVALVAGVAGFISHSGGQWMGWPSVLLLAVVLNSLWCFVA